MPSRRNRIGRIVVVLIGLTVALVVGVVAFVVLPGSLADIVGVLLALAVTVAGVRASSRLADRIFPSYNVAEVAVDGPITRDGGGRLPTTPGSTPADDIVEQIEAADADRNAAALLVRLNTPGGEVVPSDDIRRAAAAFDGPTIAYTTDLCASGGYWIATGCDALWAREGSLVGSIGVRSGHLDATGLADRLGVSYEGFSRGKFKEAGWLLKDLTDDEREYFQGLADGHYDQFVDRVSTGRDLDADEVRDTEARVYLGDEARERGLVDDIGAREDVEAALEDALGRPVAVAAFEPSRGLRERVGLAAKTMAHAFGAGVAGALVGDAAAGVEAR